MSSPGNEKPVPPIGSPFSSDQAQDGVSEWCFAIRCDRGWGEVRIRANGEFVWTGDYKPKWACLDGVSFPTNRFTPVEIVRRDVIEINTVKPFTGTPLDGRRYLCHYTTADTAIRYILPNQSLRLSSVEHLNDPRESKEWAFTVISPEGTLEPMGAVHIGQEMTARLRKGVRLACFSSDGHPLEWDRDLEIYDIDGWAHASMWAHYADNHHGVVLVFDRRRLLENSVIALASRGRVFFGPILYATPGHKAGLCPFLIDHRAWTSHGPDQSAAEHLERHIGWLFYTKHVDWSPERECRILFLGDDSDAAYVPTTGALIEIGIGQAAAEHDVDQLLSIARHTNIAISRIVWRNGLAARVPI